MTANAETAPVFKYDTREAWLHAAVALLTPMFEAAADKLRTEGNEFEYSSIPADLLISVGFGFGGQAENKRIPGQTWARCTSSDGRPTVFLSPRLATGHEAMMVLCHELLHVMTDCRDRHNKPFVNIGVALGFCGKPTTAIPGPEIEAEIFLMLLELGDYPHAALDVSKVRTDVPVGPDGKPVKGAERVRTGPSTQTNRHIAAVCMNGECTATGYTLRTSRKWLAVATPICPVCKTEMFVS